MPTAVTDLHEGQTVLDLGSGAGADVLISARRVGPSGRAIGWDLPDPKGRPVEEVRATRDDIARRVEALVADLDER